MTLTPLAAARQVNTPLAEGKVAQGGEYVLVFDGTATCNCGSDASIDNAPISAGGFTLDFWAQFDTIVRGDPVVDKRPAGGEGFVCYKSVNNGLLVFTLYYDTTDQSVSILMPDTDDHHCAITYSETGDRKLRLWLDGILVSTTGATAGNYESDAAANLMIGSRAIGGGTLMDGIIAWLRLSNTVRWLDTFTPPAKCSAPDADDDTIEIWKFNDGSGDTAIAEVSEENNADLTDCEWQACE